MGPPQPVENERSLQNSRAVTEHLTENEMTAARTKTGTEKERRTKKERMGGSMKRTDTARDMEGKSMIATGGSIGIGTGTETGTANIMVIAAGGIVILDATGKGVYITIHSSL